MHALVQKVHQGHPSFAGFESSAFGFWERGYQITRFSLDELTNGDLDRHLLQEAESTVLRGGVGTVRLALRRVGREAPVLPDLPVEIRSFARRRVWESTLGEFRRDATSMDFAPAVHIKPLVDHKLFTGTLVHSFKQLIATAHLGGDVPILCQEAVELQSEWRAYILRGRILQVCHYRGNPLLFPAPEVQRAGLAMFENQPIAFSMDWGVSSTGETVLIEVNDGFALGNYGLPGHLYTALVEARWRQLMGLTDNLVGESLEPDT